MGEMEVEAFLTELAVAGKVGASTQNQALNALLFLYGEVLDRKLEGINAVRAKRPKRMPVVLSQDEMSRLLKRTEGAVGLLCRLMYGCGLRVAEGLALRVKDVDLEGGRLEVKSGKGDKDRVLTLPRTLVPALKEQRERVRLLYEDDVRAGGPNVYLPRAYGVKNPSAANAWCWFWFFPSPAWSGDPRSSAGERRRHHLHEVGVSRELKRCAGLAEVEKRVTAHALRHSFATHLVLRGVDIRSVQELMGHADVRTTEVYTQMARAMRGEIGSPLDDL
jgi:integron integrase